MKKQGFIVIALAYLAFISIGLPDGLLGVAWPSMRTFFNLKIEALGWLLLIFTFGYLISSFYTGWLLARISVGMLLVLSCIATGLSLIAYAIAPSWWVLALFGNVSGLGAGAIDAGLNIYAAKNFTHRTINWLHAAYGVGTATGPYLMTGLLMKGFPWQSGYVIVGTSQVILALMFVFTLKQWKSDQDSYNESTTGKIAFTKTLRLPVVWLGVALFFVYTGLEASIGIWSYSLLTEARSVSMGSAGLWLSIYWGTFTLGRLLSGVIANSIESKVFLRVCILGVTVGAALLWFNFSNVTNFSGLVMMGLFCAPIFPTMIATTPSRLGTANASNAIGFQIAAATIAWSCIPAFFGFIAGEMGLASIAPGIFFLTCVLFLLHEAFLLLISQKKEGEVISAA